MKNLNLNKEITAVIVLYKDPEELIVKTRTQISNLKIYMNFDTLILLLS